MAKLFRKEIPVKRQIVYHFGAVYKTIRGEWTTTNLVGTDCQSIVDQLAVNVNCVFVAEVRTNWLPVLNIIPTL
jgi:hypothetical protein